MPNYVSGVNPKLLKWAREKAGYSLDDIAQAFRKDADEVRRWESGESLPTYNQLEKLAYSFYKRPVALFFFPAPPEDIDPRQSFRTLPDFEIENLAPDTRHAIREAQAMQIALHELSDGRNSSEKKIFQDLKVHPSTDVMMVAKQVREYLAVSLDVQIHWHGAEEALNQWRAAVQDKGLFVFKRSFKQKEISGFCLTDSEFPVIYLNNGTAKTRQIFTLFHELAHLLLNTSGITKQNDRYVDALIGDARDIEVFCNRFTGEYLVPSDDFKKRLTSEPTEQLAKKLANHYKVSREVILRKLLDRQMVSQPYYESKVSEWTAEYMKRQRGEKAGGDYYATRATYLGEKYLGLAFAKYYAGAFGLEQLADYLNVKAKSVAGLEPYALGKAAAQ